MKKNILFLFLVCSLFANATVRMPLLFADDMVLQRNKPIPVWGWADANEKVVVHFNKQTKTIKADATGKWMIKLDPEKAGGPFELHISGKNKIVIKNVLVGEVWICSGQSNMEFQVYKTRNFEKEINDANYPMIRHFGVAQDMSLTPKTDLKQGKWAVCGKETVGDFTAVGYFFAKKLYAELKIPIGIIHTSWGGTCSETWTSREAFEKSGNLSDSEQAKQFNAMIIDVPTIDIDSILKTQMKIISERIEKIQGSKVTSTNSSVYKNTTYNDANWPEMSAPELWENQQLSNLDGVVWMRKTITISKEDINKKAVLELAKIDDQDSTFVNGIKVGSTLRYDEKRRYEIPVGTLKEGTNVIAIRIYDGGGGGGIWGGASDLKLTLENTVVPLSGKWKFNVVEISSQVSPNTYPTLLYNAMLNPLIPFAFQGVLWYQGEANVGRASQYKKAFPLMITDWRTKWNQGDFPFYFVQLSSFNEFNGTSKTGSKWAELREAQTETLQLPNTGMAVTTDIGDAKDIHPTNKQDVGKRLAAIALNTIYGKKMVYSGPSYKSMEIKGNQIILTFDSIGSGLSTSDTSGILSGFEIAGTNKIFYATKAVIMDNKIIVSSENCTNPVAVHYGWADDASNANLFNKENFPASPFRTDDWKMITENEVYKISK